MQYKALEHRLNYHKEQLKKRVKDHKYGILRITPKIRRDATRLRFAAYRALTLHLGTTETAAIAMVWLADQFNKKRKKSIEHWRTGTPVQRKLWHTLSANADRTAYIKCRNLCNLFAWAHADKIKRVSDINTNVIAKWLTYNADRKAAYKTVKAMAEAVNVLNCNRVCCNPKDVYIVNILKRIKGTNTFASSQAAPISWEFIIKWHEKIASRKKPSFNEIIAHISLTMAYLSNMRAADIQRVKWSDIRIIGDNNMAIIDIYHPATKTTLADDYVRSSILHAPRLQKINVLWMLEFLAKHIPMAAKHVFMYEDKCKWKNVDSEFFRKEWRKAGRMLNHPAPEAIGSHSARVGVSTDAALANISVEDRRAHGKWSLKSKMPYLYNISRHTIGADIALRLLLKGKKHEDKLRIERRKLGVIRQKIAKMGKRVTPGFYDISERTAMGPGM